MFDWTLNTSLFFFLTLSLFHTDFYNPAFQVYNVGACIGNVVFAWKAPAIIDQTE